MTKVEAVNWLINITADIGKAEHRDLWHYEQALSEIRDMLEPAQPEQRWVPVTERMPEDLEEVNVTWTNHNPEPYYNFIKDKPFTATAVYYKEKWYWYTSTCVDFLAEYGRNPNQEIDDDIEITAWMPLPVPYRKEGEAE